ncbi:hypothetical protein Hanom_Chr05g00438931 [Helianthus anomalus]
MIIEKVISTCNKFIYMEIYNMILSGIIRVNGPGIGRVSLNPIPVPDFFSFLSPYPAHTHRAYPTYVFQVSGITVRLGLFCHS